MGIVLENCTIKTNCPYRKSYLVNFFPTSKSAQINLYNNAYKTFFSFSFQFQLLKSSEFEGDISQNQLDSLYPDDYVQDGSGTTLTFCYLIYFLKNLISKMSSFKPLILFSF